ncbi:MAG TPA: porin family protein [Cyclobacteriaceae bacterium]|nr:porin family protein [Cyclobacteriaceae bacterium]
MIRSTSLLIILFAVAAHPLAAQGKMGFGIKGGVNFANVTNAESINSSSQTGFMGGVFISPPSQGVLGFRSEVMYSRQGFNFETNTNTGSVNLDYILLPQLTTINIGKVVSLMLGFQMAFLISAKEKSDDSSSGSNPANDIMEYYNRFDYGAAGGIEIIPFKGLLIGARANISFGKLLKDPESYSSGTPPSMIPDVDLKNNVVQLYLGYRF